MAPSALPNDGNIVVEHSSKSYSVDSAKQNSAVLHRSLHHDPLKVVHASGNYLHLSSGQRIFDATGGAAVACIGHGNARVNHAMSQQIDSFSYCHSLFFSSDAAENLAAELVASTHGHMGRAFIVSSGSEAIEAAMKLARQYFLECSPPQPSRTRFIARKESYHGTTLGALSLGGHVARRALYEPMLMHGISHVSACNAYRGLRDGESPDAYVARLAQELDDEFTRVGPNTVCAFVAEPVVGAALGCVPAVPGYLAAMRAVCDKHGALFILDEIMSGMGRTGTLHAWEQEPGAAPDIQAVGKGLGGGYAPVAGILIAPRVVTTLQHGSGAFAHGQTYQGHPLACAAAAEVQRIIRDEDLLANVRARGRQLEQGLKRRLGGHRHVGDIRGRGLFWGIEFVRDRATKEPFAPAAGVAMGVHEMGMHPPFNISIYPGTGTVDGKTGDHVLLAPAYNATEADIAHVVDVTAKVIEAFFDEARL